MWFGSESDLMKSGLNPDSCTTLCLKGNNDDPQEIDGSWLNGNGPLLFSAVLLLYDLSMHHCLCCIVGSFYRSPVYFLIHECSSSTALEAISRSSSIKLKPACRPGMLLRMSSW